MKKLSPDPLLERGVWQAPFLGPNGELVLLAVTSTHSLYGSPVIVPNNESRCEAILRLTAELDRFDPVGKLVQLRVVNG